MLIKCVFLIFFLFLCLGIAQSGLLGCWWNEFECANENCIALNLQCNGKDDCGDGSDELKCVGVTKRSTTSVFMETTETTIGTVQSNVFTVDLSLPPRNITVTPDSKLFIQCRDRNFGKNGLNWYKPDGMLPFGSFIKDGQLVIPTVRCEDSGSYICYRTGRVIKPGDYAVINLEVDHKHCSDNINSVNFSPTSTTPSTWMNTSPRTVHTTPETFPTSNGYSYFLTCGNRTDCYQFCCNGTCATVVGSTAEKFRCDEGSYVSDSSVCNGVRDCPDGSDERSCTIPCYGNDFRCGDGTCIPEIQKCDGKFDCSDGTDESYCRGSLRPKLIQHPGNGMEIDCADPENQIKGSHVLQLECEFFGRPPPLVKWKHNEDYVPSKCIVNSNLGHGILVCPNFQQSDQGAYSCVGENSIGSAESQPKTVIKCKTITCKNGFRVRDEHNIETCIKCYCSGRTDSCHNLKSKVNLITFNFPETKVDMISNGDGEIFLPNSSNVNSDTLRSIKYCLMPEDQVQSYKFMMSYGRKLYLPAVNKKTNFMPNAPDIIITGRGVMLKYSISENAQNSTTMNIRFWNDNWQHSDGRHASRDDIMHVLTHLEQLYIRCEYQKGVISGDPFAKIKLESALISDEYDTISYIEKCSCPSGYDGLSCELCAPGYKRDPATDTCILQPIPPFICPVGMIGEMCDECDVLKLYYRHKNGNCVKSTCNDMGSVGLFPDVNDNCICKERVTGKNCDTCKVGYFHLDKENPKGCKKCWCNNVTSDCESSYFQKIAISSSLSALGGFNESNGGNFWLLPPDFSGNLIKSYGGFIHYTIKYESKVEKELKPLTVEILGGDGITLRYVNNYLNVITSETERRLSVPIEEPHWRDSSNIIVSRDKLLFVLIQVRAIFIESPYHLSLGKVKLTSVELDTADDMSNDVIWPSIGQVASKVEMCKCPVGYEGTSCETCSVGYYRQKNGLDNYFCEKCECDIRYCDSLRGCAVCPKGKYNNNTNPSEPPICLNCPCNGNEESCTKDDYNFVMCFCKSGFYGAKCEIEDNIEGDFQVWLFPITVVKKIGASVMFNCSYMSKEEHRIEFQKKYSKNPPSRSELFKVENYGWSSTLETNLEQDLESVECIIRNLGDEVVAKVTAKVIGTGTDYSRPSITNCYDEPKTVIEKEDVFLRCDVTGSPEPNVTWHRVDQNGEFVQLNTTDGVHTIPAVDLSLNGTIFTCIAQNSQGDARCMIHLIVKKRCILWIQPVNPEVVEGESIEFNCTTETGSPITWSRTNDLLLEDVIISGGKMFIPEVHMNHMGEYKCTAMDPSGPSVKTTRLIVKKRRIAPTAMILQPDTIISLGDSLTIECRVTGDPKPEIIWSKLGETTLPENIRISKNNNELIFINAELDNTGLYQCRAESFLNATSRILITVLEIPEIIIKPEEIFANVGDTVEVDCIPIKGNPLKSIGWTSHYNWLDDGEIPGRKLRFENIRSEDGGIYYCTAINGVGRAEGMVDIRVGKVPNVVLEPNGTLDAVRRDQVDLECYANGDPIPTTTWLIYHKVKGVLTSFQKSVEINKEAGRYLTLEITEDLDSVVCVANNSFGVVNSSVVFNVKSEKPVIPGVSKQVLLGTRVELDFSSLGGKINCTKLKGSMIGDECYTPKGLEIMNAQVQHSGTYKCVSKTSEMSYTIKVDGFVNRFKKSEMSYLILPLTVKSRREFKVEITFKAERLSGLLLVKKKHHAFLMYLKRGKLSVRLRRHSEEITLTMKKSLQLFVWNTAVFRLHNTAELILYDENGLVLEKVTDTRNFEMSWMINAEDNLYLGGMKLSERHLPLNPVDAHFEGCVSRLIVDDHEYKITEEGKLSRNVSLCNVCASEENICGMDAVCYDAPTHYGFVCVCQKDNCRESCRGIGCITKFNPCELVRPCGHEENHCLPYGGGLKCHCASGYSGITCDEEIAVEFSLNGNGYVVLPETYLPRNSIGEPEVITIHFTMDNVIQSQRVMLFSQGKSSDYLQIYLQDHSVIYEYNNQNENLHIVGPMYITKGFRVKVTRRNNTATLEVNGDLYKEEVPFTTNRVHGDIYIGGLPKETSSVSGFSGCIHMVKINGKEINTLAKNITRRNISRRCKVASYTAVRDESSSLNDDGDDDDTDDGMDENDSDHPTKFDFFSNF